MKTGLLIISLLFCNMLYSQCINCKSFEEALLNPEMVKTIKINGNRDKLMDSLPVSIGLFKNLTILYFSDQNINSIPKEIGNLKSLQELSFAGCKLTLLPEEIFQLSNLKELILLDNEFSEKYIKQLGDKFKKQMPGTRVLF